MQGKTVNGYTLQRLLGAGGMAEVWLAENKIGKKAAVKLLLPKLCADDDVKSRFFTEAKVTVNLNHPNIRQVYDFDEVDGRPAIVMEYLEGADLKARMKNGQRFTDEELKRWWGQLASALNYTHQRGVVHRDIKPGNIFVDNDGNAKLLDFGIAKVRESISSTQTGQKLGTLMYMSPEQVKDSKHIDYRTDLYSLAVTFVNLITGKKPYDSDTSSDFEISEQIVYKPLELNGLPMKWQNFLAPYLEKDPAKRPSLKTFETVVPTPSQVFGAASTPKEPSAFDALPDAKEEETVVEQTNSPNNSATVLVTPQAESKETTKQTQTEKFEWVLPWIGFVVLFELIFVRAFRYFHGLTTKQLILIGLMIFGIGAAALGFFVWLFKKLSKKYDKLPWVVAVLSTIFVLIWFYLFYMVK